MHIFKRIYDCFFAWKLKHLPEWNEEAQVVCACSFGRRDESCNEVIAAHITRLIQQHHVPYCVQGEIGKFIDPELSGYSSAENPCDLHTAQYVGTREVVVEQWDNFLSAHSLSKLHVEAHPEHAWRVVKCYEKLGLKVVSLNVGGIPYPPKSSQKRCRSKWRFVPYEILARLLYVLKGYI